jgi:SAM-dependent methyltransferase
MAETEEDRMNNESISYWKRFFGPMNLSLGSSGNHSLSKDGEKWINLDMNPKANPDVLHNLNDLPLPFADNTFDCVLATHVFEHLDKIKWVYVVADIHRILKPGGALIAVTPHGSSDIAMAQAQHKGIFFEATWNTIRADSYTQPGSTGYLDDEGLPFRDWVFDTCILVPWPEFKDDPDLEYKATHYRNYINEMHVILKAVK